MKTSCVFILLKNRYSKLLVPTIYTIQPYIQLFNILIKLACKNIYEGALAPEEHI